LCPLLLSLRISSPPLFKLLEYRPMFRFVVIMFREEFYHTMLHPASPHPPQVDRSNCRPPPKVGSRVIRVERRNPLPPVNFTEWDGMIRVILNRKHKAPRLTLTTKASLK
ncbi:unnamed protein product, partial [Hapterophycus canaliculatus]